MKTRIADRIVGCLVGGAVGDALGYPVEFMSRQQILSRYGEKGITRYELNSEGVAEVSDDTQMTLFTANGLIWGWAQKKDGSDLSRDEYIAEAYLDWLDTQRYARKGRRPHICWLNDVEALYARRAPGITCLTSLRNLMSGSEVMNDSKGCGGVMRVAPVGLFAAAGHWYLDKSETVRLGAEAARLTHHHPLGFLPAAVMAYLVRESVLCEQPVPEDFIKWIHEGLDWTATVYGRYEDELNFLSDLLERAILLSQVDRPVEEILPLLGEGWVAEETLAIAVYCVLKYWKDFESVIVAAVNHNGDSDSTGAVAGNLAGALWGEQVIPEYYKEHLELRDIIEEMADDLLVGFPEDICSDDPKVVAWNRKYRNEV